MSEQDGICDSAHCLNCGTALVGKHCHNCGQRAHLHRTIRAFLHDLAHGALHFEGAIWRTLPKLALKPGELTRRYIDGERARFVSPMALFLFALFLMFAAFQIMGVTAPADISAQSDPEMRASVAAEQHRVGQRINELEAALAQASSPARRDEIRAELDDLRLEERLINSAGSIVLLPGTDAAATGPAARTGPEVRLGNGLDVPGLDTLTQKWSGNPGLMLYKLQANFYKFSWLLIPISIPFVWLLFAWRRQFGGYDHAVFVTYSLAFMSLFLVFLTVLGKLGVATGVLLTAGPLLALAHVYRHLRGTYRLSRLSALWRLAVLWIFIVIIMAMFLQLLLLLGLFG